MFSFLLFIITDPTSHLIEPQYSSGASSKVCLNQNLCKSLLLTHFTAYAEPTQYIRTCLTE